MVKLGRKQFLGWKAETTSGTAETIANANYHLVEDVSVELAVFESPPFAIVIRTSSTSNVDVLTVVVVPLIVKLPVITMSLLNVLLPATVWLPDVAT